MSELPQDPGYLARWVGGNLKACREAVGLSRRELAARMCVGPEQVARMERGQRNATLASAERQADAIGVEDVLGLDNGDLFREPADFAAVLVAALVAQDGQGPGVGHEGRRS